jgi:hypothetical protein
MQIFLSYARDDEAFATTLAQDLKTKGARIWFDLFDGPNDDPAAWDAAVQSAMHASDGLIVIVSPAALQQDYIQSDWQYFLAESRPIIVVVAQPCNIPPALVSSQPVHFYHDYQSGINRLQYLLLEQSRRLVSSPWQQAKMRKRSRQKKGKS